MPKVIPPEKIEKANALLKSGKTPLAEVARSAGISVSKARELAIALGVTPPKPSKAKASQPAKGSSSGPSSDSRSSASSPPSAPSGETPSKAAAGEPLEALVAAHPSAPGLPFPSGGDPEGEPQRPQEPEPPPLDSKALLALVYTTKATVVSNCAMVWRLELSEAEAERLCSFTNQEKEALEALAPHTAAYTGYIARYAGGAMAVLFVAMFGASTYRSVVELKRMRPAPEDRSKVPAEKRKGAKK